MCKNSLCFFNITFGITEKDLTFAPLFLNDSLAQQVEHIPFKDGVLGSSPRRITCASEPYRKTVRLF